MNAEPYSPSEPDLSKGNALYERTVELIPTGTMLLSKRPERHAPDRWPAYYRRAWGAKVEDLDGNVYTDMTGDVGATLLGRADPDVNAAVKEVIDQGNFCYQNYPGEGELAELLCEIIPCAEMARFVRGGGEADVVAIRIARGYTQRDRVAFCGYHGWHDWYIAANLADDSTLDGHLIPGLRPLGVPRGLTETAMPFEFNDVDSLKRLLEAHPGEFAAVIMEATRYYQPEEGFLEGVRELATRHGAVLIFDEVVTGFRMALGGAAEYFNVIPDMATFAKTISNGYPMGAVLGRREIMQTVSDEFISSTYWTDAIGTAAALASLKKIRSTGAIEHAWKLGQVVLDGLKEAVDASGVDGKIYGWPPFPALGFPHDDEDTSLARKAFFVRRMLARGFLAGGLHYIMLAHTREDVDGFLAAARESFSELKSAIDRGSVLDDIDHKPGYSLFKRLA